MKRLKFGIKAPLRKKHVRLAGRPTAQQKQYDAIINQALLKHPGLFEDGLPHWKEGRLNKPCQSASQAKDQRLLLIKRLHRFGAGHKSTEHLSARLAGCAPTTRCLSGACPECARAFQRLVLAATKVFLRGHGVFPAGSSILSPISTEGKIAPGSLN